MAMSRREHTAGDTNTLTSRIRSRLPSVAIHPNAINISAKNGKVTLTGAAFIPEGNAIESMVSSLPGVNQVQSQLSLVDKSEAERFSQHITDQVQHDSDFMRPRLLPLSRVVLGLSGAVTAYYGARQRSLLGLLTFGLGFGAVIRAITNLETAHLVGLVLHPTVKLQRTIDVDAPVEAVFDFWKNFSSFSRFMSYVREVRVNEKQGFTWTVVGPAGVRIQWDAFIHRLVPNQVIAWQSLPRSLIMNSGHVTFWAIKGDKTRVEVLLVYAPPVGVLGYGAIILLGFDPRERIDDDLLIMKNLIETEYREQGLRRELA